jgi:hypothetical protein
VAPEEPLENETLAPVHTDLGEAVKLAVGLLETVTVVLNESTQPVAV